MWTYDDARAAIRDALRLSRGMTYKSAVAGLPLGGGKGVIMLRPGQAVPDRADVLRDFADAVERMDGAYVTAEDVGTSTADMDVIAERTTHVTGRAPAHGGSGDPSPWTALGVVTAIEVACEQRFGTADMAGRSVAVVGMGSVGFRVAEQLAAAGARIVAADIDESKRGAAEALGAQWMAPDAAALADVDVYAPCALGAVLNEETIPALRAQVVAGAANNQLANDGDAAALAERGILWVPDFVANAGGIINISVELAEGGYDAAVAEERVRGIGDTVRSIIAAGGDPLAAAMALAERNLAA